MVPVCFKNVFNLTIEYKVTVLENFETLSHFILCILVNALESVCGLCDTPYFPCNWRKECGEINDEASHYRILILFIFISFQTDI